jgi:hypothetical protein
MGNSNSQRNAMLEVLNKPIAKLLLNATSAHTLGPLPFQNVDNLVGD